MSKVEETLQELIEFSQQQLLLKQRELEAQGKASNNIILDAYRTIIANLTGVLGSRSNKTPTQQPSEKAPSSDSE